MFALLGGPARPDLERFGCHALGQEIILAAGAAGICLAGAAPYEPHRKYSIFAWRPSGFNCGKRPDQPAAVVAKPPFPPIRISADHTPCTVHSRGVGWEMDQDGSPKAPTRGASMNSPTVAVSSIAAAATAMTELQDDGTTGIMDFCNDICKCRDNGRHLAAVGSAATPAAALLHVEGMAYVPFIRRASLFTKIRGYRPTQITPGFEQRLAFLVEALGAGIGDEGNDNDRVGGLRRLGAVYVRSGCVELIMEEEEWGDDESLENEVDAEELELPLGTVGGYRTTGRTVGYDTRTEPSSPPSLPQPSPQELPLQPRSAGLQPTRAVTRDEGPAVAAAITVNAEAAATSNMGPAGNDGTAVDFKPFPHFLDMETGLPSAAIASGAVSGFRSRDGRSSGRTSLSSMELTAIIQALQLQDEEGAVSEERWKEKAEEEEGSQEAAEEEAFAAEALSVVASGSRVVAVTAAVESLCDGTAEVAVCGGQGFRESIAPSTSNCNWSTEPHAPAAPFLLGPEGEQRYGIRVDAVQPRMLLLWAPPPLLASSEGVGPATAIAASASGRVAAAMQAPVPSPQLATEERRHQALRLDTAQSNAAAAATTASAAAAEIHLQLQRRHLSERRQGWLRGQSPLQLQPQLQPLPISIPEHQAREHLEDSVTAWDIPRGRSHIPAHIEAQDSGPVRPPNVGAVPNPHGGREGTSTTLAAAAVLHVAVRCPAVMTAEEGPGGLEVLFRSQGSYLPLRARWLVGSGGGGSGGGGGGGMTLQSEAADATTTATNGDSASHVSLGRHSESSVTFGHDSVLQNSEPVTSFTAAAARGGAAVVVDDGVVAAAAAAAAVAAGREGGGDAGTAGRGDGRGAVPGPVPDVMVGADVDQLQILVLEVLELPRRPGIALVDFRWRGRPCRAVPLVLTTDPAVAAELQAAVAAWSRPQVELDELLLDYGTWEFHVSSAVPAPCTAAVLPASTSISPLDATAALVRGGNGSCNLSNRMRGAPDGAEPAMQISTRRLVQLSVHLLAYASASGWVCTAAYIQVQLHNLSTTCGASRTGVAMKVPSCHGHGGMAVVAEMQVMDGTEVPEPQLQAMETEAEMGADARHAVELHQTWLQSTAATAAAAHSAAVDKAKGRCRGCSKAACALCVGASNGIVHAHGSVGGPRVPWASAVILPALGLSRITPAETSAFHQFTQACIHALSPFLLAFDVASLIALFLCDRYQLLTSITTTILAICIVSLFVVLVCLVLPHATWRRLLLASRYYLIVDYIVTNGLAGLAGLTHALGMMASPWSWFLRPTWCIVLPAAFLLASRGAAVSLTLAAGMSYMLLAVKGLASFPALAAAQGLTTAGLGLATTAVCQAYLRYSLWKQQQHQTWHPSEPS